MYRRRSQETIFPKSKCASMTIVLWIEKRNGGKEGGEVEEEEEEETLLNPLLDPNG